VLPAMLRKFAEAQRSRSPVVTLWGTGAPRREFLHVDDLASACYSLLTSYDEDLAINVGTGEDISVRDLAELIAGITEYSGAIRWDSTKPDGTPRKVLDTSRIRALGWTPTVSLVDGIRQTYEWYRGELSGCA
jgi:GDP-L-fucose synthase